MAYRLKKIVYFYNMKLVKISEHSRAYSVEGDMDIIITKCYDGLKFEDELFNSMVLRFLKNPIIRHTNDLPQGPLWLFKRRLEELLSRVSKSRTPILPKGGGGSLMINRYHIPHLQNLLFWLRNATGNPLMLPMGAKQEIRHHIQETPENLFKNGTYGRSLEPKRK